MKVRYKKLDYIRGIALINMIIYHALWDMVYIFNYDIPWFDSRIAYVWQQCICYTFILLSGFCFSFSKNNLIRGLKVFALGLVVTLVTVFVLPDEPIIFGVLTLIGSSMIMVSIIRKYLDKINCYLGIFIFLFLFIICRNVNSGYLGYESINLIKLPSSIYSNFLTTYLGFPYSGFISSDYFSIIPWIFLFISGYYLNKIFVYKKLMINFIKSTNYVVEYIGSNSLIVYALHQPIIYLLLMLFA